MLKSLEWRLQHNPSLSPDGRYIAYGALTVNPSTPPDPFNLDSRDQHIYILAADGSSETDLTKVAGINVHPVWSPDGANVLFISDRYGSLDLWSIPVQGGKAAGAARW